VLRRTILLLLIVAAVVGVVLYRNVGPTLACGLRSTRSFRPGLSLHSIESGGIKRCYWLNLPETAPASRSMALVFSLHGFSSNPRGQRSYSRWDQVAAEHGAAVVYPQGSGFPLRWNALPGAYPGSPDDVAFFKNLLAELEAALPIDPERVYVTGLSNGGAMTLRLLCEAGELIRAAGTVAAPVTTSIAECETGRVVPLIAFHGTADPVVDFEGWIVEPDLTIAAPGRPFQSETVLAFEAWTEIWAVKSGCSLTPEILFNNPEVFARRYAGCDGGAAVEAYTIFGGGHTWPGGAAIPFVGETSRAISASQVMWDFFEGEG
jgi:polyhydroxybutyrate depolymerase